MNVDYSTEYHIFAHRAYTLLKRLKEEIGYPQLTIATAMVYFHRFYSLPAHTPTLYPPTLMAIVCVFLAGKVEANDGRPWTPLQTIIDKAMPTEPERDQRQEQLITLEAILIRALQYDFLTQHPYQIIKRQTRGFSDDMQAVCLWLVNDSFYTPLCVKYSQPSDVALSVLALGAKCFGVEGEVRPHIRELAPEVEKDVCLTLLAFYARTGRQPKNAKLLELVEEFRKSCKSTATGFTPEC